MARPLLPVVLALMAGLTAAAWGLSLPERWLIGGLLLLWVTLAALWLARRPARCLPLAFFGLLGVAFYQQALHPPYPPHHLVNLPQGQEIAILGRLNRPARLGEERVQLFMAAQAWLSPQGWRPATGNLLVAAPNLAAPPVGTDLVLRGKLHAPRVLHNPGTFDRPRFLAADGIFRELRLKDRGHLVFLATGDYPLAERLRGSIRQLLKLSPAPVLEVIYYYLLLGDQVDVTSKIPHEQLLKPLDSTLQAFYLSMMLGDQGEITQEMRHNLARTGTSHLLVVNGLHLGMVAAVLGFLSLWLMRCSAWLLLRINAVKIATLLAAAAVVGYAWVAGGSPSTQRAEIMVLAYLLLVFLGRPQEIWSTLTLAALIILSLAPLRLFSISFQLSFAAVAGLMYSMPLLLKLSRSFERESPDGLFQRDSHLIKKWLKDTLIHIFRKSDDEAENLAFKLEEKLWIAIKWWIAISPGTRLLMVSLIATLATAPLVALYFQIVSIAGILVNLVAIPLVLGIALPLGEAAIFALGCNLPTIAQGLLYLGQFPLWLGWQAIRLGASWPGSAIIVPIPTWPQIGLYFLILLLIFAPRRRLWTWGVAGLAGIALIFSAAWPTMSAPRVLEVTCLDTYGSLECLIVSPEGQRLVVSAPARSWPGRPGSGSSFGPMPAYCHWRQFRSLDQAVALSLSQDNAGELLTLAEQFQVGGFWYGRRGYPGPALWDLWNYLGDRHRLPLPLEPWRRGPPPPAKLGSVSLDYLKLNEDKDFALGLSGSGRQVLILPPGRRPMIPPGFKPTSPGLDLLVLPAALAESPDLPDLMARLRPRELIVYGGDANIALQNTRGPCHFTRGGAVSAYLNPAAVNVRQWGR